MKEITGSRSSWTRAGIRSLGTVRTDQEPAGRSVSASSSPRISEESGVAGAGFRMIGTPTAMAGATLWALRFSGKLKGAMPSTVPRGKRRVRPSRPVPPASVSRRWASPLLNRRASSEAKRKTDTARPTSPRAHLTGLPFSAEISWAISSVRSASRRATWSSAAARTWAGVAANSSRTACAAATASSTWASVGTETVPTRRPSQELVTSKLSSPVAWRPASQKAWVEVMAFRPFDDVGCVRPHGRAAGAAWRLSGVEQSGTGVRLIGQGVW